MRPKVIVQRTIRCFNEKKPAAPFGGGLNPNLWGLEETNSLYCIAQIFAGVRYAGRT
jgi:hypothetical protein